MYILCLTETPCYFTRGKRHGLMIECARARVCVCVCVCVVTVGLTDRYYCIVRLVFRVQSHIQVFIFSVWKTISTRLFRLSVTCHFVFPSCRLCITNDHFPFSSIPCCFSCHPEPQARDVKHFAKQCRGLFFRDSAWRLPVLQSTLSEAPETTIFHW